MFHRLTVPALVALLAIGGCLAAESILGVDVDAEPASVDDAKKIISVLKFERSKLQRENAALRAELEKLKEAQNGEPIDGHADARVEAKPFRTPADVLDTTPEHLFGRAFWKPDAVKAARAWGSENLTGRSVAWQRATISSVDLDGTVSVSVEQRLRGGKYRVVATVAIEPATAAKLQVGRRVNIAGTIDSVDTYISPRGQINGLVLKLTDGSVE